MRPPFLAGVLIFKVRAAWGIVPCGGYTMPRTYLFVNCEYPQIRTWFIVKIALCTLSITCAILCTEVDSMNEQKNLTKKTRYNIQYAKEKIKRVPLDMQLADYEALKSAAATAGEGVNTYIKRAIAAQMERERAKVVPVGSPVEEDRPGGGFGFSVGSPEETICSRLSSQWGPDFQTALSDSGQTEEEYITQAVMERATREQKPIIPQWIAERYPGERWPVLQAVRALQGNMNAQRCLHASMTQEQRAEWDKEFRRELDEERRESAGQDTQKPTCNLPLD